MITDKDTIAIEQNRVCEIKDCLLPINGDGFRVAFRDGADGLFIVSGNDVEELVPALRDAYSESITKTIKCIAAFIESAEMSIRDLSTIDRMLTSWPAIFHIKGISCREVGPERIRVTLFLKYLVPAQKTPTRRMVGKERSGFLKIMWARLPEDKLTRLRFTCSGQTDKDDVLAEKKNPDVRDGDT